MNRPTNRFEKGSGCYDCRSCGRKTRSTGQGDNEGVRLCTECWDLSGETNHLSDNGTLYATPESVSGLMATLQKHGKNPSELFPEVSAELIRVSKAAGIQIPYMDSKAKAPRNRVKKFDTKEYAEALFKQARHQEDDGQLKFEDALEYLIQTGLEEDEIPPVAEESLRIALQELIDQATEETKQEILNSESDDCYAVIIHNDDWTVAELTAVPARAARFARRMARNEWVAAGNSADGITFNARAAGSNNA